jgi:hypothetical protein
MEVKLSRDSDLFFGAGAIYLLKRLKDNAG